MLKNCPGCSKTLLHTAFNKDASHHDGMQGLCKICQKLQSKRRRDAAKAGISLVSKPRTKKYTTPPSKKRCPRCEEVKPRDQFYPSKAASDGLQSYCRQCYLDYLRDSKDARPPAS